MTSESLTTDELASRIQYGTGGLVGIDVIEPTDDGWTVTYWRGLDDAQSAEHATLNGALRLAYDALQERGLVG